MDLYFSIDKFDGYDVRPNNVKIGRWISQADYLCTFGQTETSPPYIVPIEYDEIVYTYLNNTGGVWRYKNENVQTQSACYLYPQAIYNNTPLIQGASIKYPWKVTTIQNQKLLSFDNSVLTQPNDLTFYYYAPVVTAVDLTDYRNIVVKIGLIQNQLAGTATNFDAVGRLRILTNYAEKDLNYNPKINGSIQIYDYDWNTLQMNDTSGRGLQFSRKATTRKTVYFRCLY